MGNRRLERIELLLERLDAAVVVRDPANARAAEAFDGLRKLLIQSGTSHRSHVSHLLSLSDSINRGASIELIRDRVGDYLSELRVLASDDVSNPDFFEVTEGEGNELECLVPAIVERLDDGRTTLVRHGKAKRIPAPAGAPVTQSADSTAAISPSPEEEGPASSRPGALFISAISIINLLIGLLIGLLI
jgi:hypothetical protein